MSLIYFIQPEILNRMDSTISDEILTEIKDEQPLIDAIRHYMFTFEDLLLVDATAMKEVVAKIDRKLLTIALKGTSDQLKNHFLQCMSQRGGEMLKEDMEAAGPVRIRDVDSHYNLIYLFAATPVGGAPGTTGALEWSPPGDGRGRKLSWTAQSTKRPTCSCVSCAMFWTRK